MKDHNTARTPTRSGDPRGLLVVLALAASPWLHAQITPDAQVVFQARFEQGLQLLREDEYAAAAQAFNSLYQDTRRERVRLEWARSAYLAEDYDTAEQLFRLVKASGPPPAVREKIDAFLEDIALVQGRFDYSFSLVRDTNPRALPTVRTFNLFGLPFEYKPEVDDSPKWGLNYRLSGSKGLDSARRWIGSAGVLGTHFADPQMNRLGFDAHLTYRFKIQPTLQVKGSYERLNMAGDALYRYSWLTLLHAHETEAGWRFTQELRHGHISYPLYPFQNSALTSYRLLAEKQLSARIVMGVELGWNGARAKESPYSYSGLSQGWFGTVYAPTLDAKIQVKHSRSIRDHAIEDPFFGIKRLDTRVMTTVSVESPSIRMGSLIPSLEVGVEKNHSTLPLSQYERVIANLSFRRTF